MFIIIPVFFIFVSRLCEIPIAFGVVEYDFAKGEYSDRYGEFDYQSILAYHKYWLVLLTLCFSTGLSVFINKKK